MKKVIATACAALLAGTIAWGANVYSVNAVGYVKKDLPAGYSLLSTPFSAVGGTAIDLQTLLGSVPEDTAVFFSVPGGGYDTFVYLSWAGGWVNATTFAAAGGEKVLRGESFWIQLPSATTLSLAGEVPGAQDATNKINLIQGYQLVASAYPAATVVANSGSPTGGLTPNTDDVIYIPKTTGSGYDTYVYLDYLGGWLDAVSYSPATISFAPASGGWYNSAGAGTNVWSQSKPYVWP